MPLPASKPKIWSLADTAACKTPPHHLHPLGHAAGGQEMNSNLHHNHHLHHLNHPPHEGGHPMQEQQQDGNPWAGQAYSEQHHYAHHMGPESSGHHHPHPAGGMGSNLAAMQGLADSLNASGGDGPSPVSNFQEAPHQMASPGNGLMLQYNNIAYGRAPPSGFLGGSRQFSNSMDTDSRSYSQHMNALTGPPQELSTNLANHSLQHPGSAVGLGNTTPHPHSHQQHRSSSNGSSSSSSHTGTPPVGMGSFPELQTDTPPQTPPNMKLPSVAGNLLTAAAANANSATGTCYSNVGVRGPAKGSSSGGAYSHTMPSSPSSIGSAPGFRQDCSGNAMTGVDSDQDSFKTTSSSPGSTLSSPFFKR